MTGGDRELIREIVLETIRELKRAGVLKNTTDLAYTEAASMLKSFYRRGEDDTAIAAAIKKHEKDFYYKIIPLYFRYSYTIEDIAEVFDVEPSTISRNKKRLCIAIYNELT